MPSLKEVQKTLRQFKNPQYAAHSQKFFKTGKGEYGEGDVFLGIRVPQVRKVAKQFKELSFKECEQLLKSKFHEERLLALVILVHKFQKGDEKIKERIFKLYLRSPKYINNWDLVDVSAHKILGPYVEGKDLSVLDELAQSKNLWKRRMAMISTFHFLRDRNFSPILRVAKILLNDDHDLIHKAVGWALREVGNRHLNTEKEFLKKYYKTMPKTMLRYAVEKFPKELRKKYYDGKV